MPSKPKTRIAELREKVQTAEQQRGSTFDVPFRGKTIPLRGKTIPLRKIRIKTSFPLYRIKSGRTRLAQSAYLEEHPSLPKDFFEDPEDAKVQKAQHEILLRMIQQKDLNKDLEDRGQREPLVLTRDGVVVDGNRRLAALRDESQEYVDAVVLPDDAEAPEIYETELELQMQRETKAPYGWIDQALHIEYGIKVLGESTKIVAARMRLSEKDVTEELEKLNVLRSYLEWIGEPGKYHRIPGDNTDAKQAFGDLAQRLASKAMLRKPEIERRMIREACFGAIKHDAGYRQVRAILSQVSQHPSEVLSRIREKRPKISSKRLRTGKKKPKPEVTDDPLKTLVGDEPANVSADVVELGTIFEDAEKSGDVAPVLLEIVDELEDEDKGAKRQQRPLERIRTAATNLAKVDLDKTTEGLGEIARELSRVFEEAERIRRRLEVAQSSRRK